MERPKIVLVDPFADLPDEEPPEGRSYVRFQPYGTEIRARNGRTLLESARLEGVGLPHACGGRARCTTCRVRVLAGPESLSGIEVMERRALELYGIRVPGMRLGCQARVTGDCEVHVEMTPEQAIASWSESARAAWRPRGGWK